MSQTKKYTRSANGIQNGTNAGNTTSMPPQISDTDSSQVQCIICAEKVIYSAISPCNNVTCHVCCLRQRGLFKKKTCLVCRTDHDDVVFTEKVLEEAKFVDFVDDSRPIYLEEFQIHFTSPTVKDETLKLLLHDCPICHENFKKFHQLNEHTKTQHTKYYCDICVSHGNRFISELTLYTQKLLQKHINDGDKTGFVGHPKCKFCRGKRFYSEDELNIHIRDRHERCYICNLDNYQANDYYRNYDDLYDHFKQAHYVCTVPSCVEKRFVVFREDLDLTAHMLKEHGGIMGQGGKIVIGASSSHFNSQLSTFDVRSHGQASRQDNDLNLKKRRLEERVKHYLLNDQQKLAKFEKITSDFKIKRVSASEVVRQCESLFENIGGQELSLVLYELIEIQPAHSDRRASLQLAYDELTSRFSAGSSTRSFPLLGSSRDRHVLNNLSWVSGTNSSKKSLDEQFPALVKPSRPKQAPVNNGPVKYTMVKKQPALSNTTTSKKITFKENTQYKPTYLNNSKSQSSVASLPMLGLSGEFTSLSREISRPQSPAQKGTLSTLSESKFPMLAAKKKTEIPRVKPIPKQPSGWGPGLIRSEPEAKDDWGIPIIDKKAEKLRRKAERANSKEPPKK